MNAHETASGTAPPAVALRKLQDSQLNHFDRDRFTDEMWERLSDRIAADFPDGRFRFLDVGGGNGSFADGLLSRFPASHGVLIDNAEVLIARNAPHPRKTIICQSCESMEPHLGGSTFDLINVNFLLHHLVSDSYERTRRAQTNMLAAAARMLSPRGRISVFETLYDGLVLDGAPSWLIYQFTASRILAPVTRRMGANTAGCGVCFLSEAQWRESFRSLRFDVAWFRRYERRPFNPLRQLALHIRSRGVGHFWLAAAQSFH